MSFPFYHFQPVFRVYPQTLLVSTIYYLILKYCYKLINFLLIFQKNLITIEMSRQYNINNETNVHEENIYFNSIFSKVSCGTQTFMSFRVLADTLSRSNYLVTASTYKFNCVAKKIFSFLNCGGEKFCIGIQSYHAKIKMATSVFT